MAFSLDNNEFDNKLLYQLFEQHVKNEMREKLRPVVDRVLDECLDAALDSMKGALYKEYELMNDSRLIKIILEKK